MSSILVTGAAGFAGSHLVDMLVAAGHEVTGWRRPTQNEERRTKNEQQETKSGERTQPGVKWQEVDLLDRASVARAIGEIRPQDVYHCAGAAHVGRSWSNVQTALATNALGTHHLLEALRVANLDARVLIPGSAMVYRQSQKALHEEDPIGPSSPYAVSKLAQEMIGQRSAVDEGQRIFLTRSFNHTGARQDPTYAASGFARQIATIEAGKAEPVIRVGNLDAVRDLHDVRDTVRAYQGILEHGRPGVIYNVCSGQPHKISGVLNRLVEKSRVPVAVTIDPERYRPNDTLVVLGDFGRLKMEVGWSPRIPLDKTLDDLLDYWRNQFLSDSASLGLRG